MTHAAMYGDRLKCSFNCKCSGIQTVLTVAAMTPDEAKGVVYSQANVQHFGKAPVASELVSRFAGHLSTAPSLMIDADFYRENLAVRDSFDFCKEAIKAADEVVTACISMLLSRNAK